MWKNHVYFGQYYHSLSFNEYEAQPDGFMAIKDGKVQFYKHLTTRFSTFNILF